MTPEELGVNIKQFAENNYSKSRGMALIHIFNNKKLAPTSDGSFKYVPDKVLDKILVGMFTYIQDNHYMEFNCMRAGATDLSDCTNLVPKTEFVIPN
jgi:predicted neuraminidase